MSGPPPGGPPPAAPRTCWWSVAKSELHNLRQLLAALPTGPGATSAFFEIPAGMFRACNFMEEECWRLPPGALRLMVERRAHAVATRLAASHPCVAQTGRCTATHCELRDLPAYTCRRFLEGKCPRPPAECPYEHAAPSAAFLPLTLRLRHPPPSDDFRPAAEESHAAAGSPVLADPAAPVPPASAPSPFPSASAEQPAAPRDHGPESHRDDAPPPPPKVIPVPEGLTCGVEEWRSRYAAFVEELKLDLLEGILQYADS